MAGILDMMLFIADENAQEVRAREHSRSPGGVVTAAVLEKQEWDAFKAKIARRSKLLGVGDIEEDDADLLLALIAILERTHEKHDGTQRSAGGMGLTLSEIVREMQNDKVLSREFPAAARTQTQRLLGMLREMHRVWVDQNGRFSLNTGIVGAK